MPSKSQSVAEATFEFMRRTGIDAVFGNPGSTELRMFRGWPDDLRYILALQEGSAVSMADGWAQASGKAGLVNLHSAAGLGHAMSAVFSANYNRAPLVIVAGQQSRPMLPYDPYLFATDPTLMPMPHVRWACQPARGADVPAILQRAWLQALEPPRGPVFISVPEDDWDQQASPYAHRKPMDTSIDVNRSGIETMAHALSRAKNPAVVANSAVEIDHASAQFVQLAELLGAKFWIGPLVGRKGVPERHPLFAGTLIPTKKGSSEQLAEHDVAVVFGGPCFQYHVDTPGQPLGAKTRLFLVTDNPGEIASATAGEAYRGSAGKAIRQITERLKESRKRAKGSKQTNIRVKDEASAVSLAGRLAPAPALREIYRVMPKHLILVEESPSHRGKLMNENFPMRSGWSYFASACGQMGWALPASAGIALARSGKRAGEKILTLIGEGSLMYQVQALWTMVQWRLDVTTVVLQNEAYASLKGLAATMGIEGAPGQDLPDLNVAGIAEGFGVPCVRADHAGMIADAVKRALEIPGPAMVVIPVEIPTGKFY